MNMIILGGLVLVAIYLTAMLILVQLKKDNTIGNFTWGGGCVLLALYTFFATKTYLPRQTLVTTLITLWGIRLIVYLYSRYKKGADPRFVAWQQQWGRYALLASFWWIWIAQGALLLVMSYLGVFVNLVPSSDLNALDITGLIGWIIGFVFESVGDYQLYRFMKERHEPEAIMNRGLWRFTRHPNYFGEILMWWGLYLIALSIPWGWTTIISPLTINILLIFFTGIPWTEAVFKGNPQYELYKKKTSMLIPWWPRS
jgi:steroid 5-alpha reductase family enzyme